MAMSGDDSSMSKASNNCSAYSGKRKKRRQSGRQGDDLEASISAFVAQLSESQLPDKVLEQRSKHTQDPSHPARDNTPPTSHTRCSIHAACQLPSSLADGWIVLQQFETELSDWNAGCAPFPPPMPKPCLIEWFCDSSQDIARAWQQLELDLQGAIRGFRSPG